MSRCFPIFPLVESLVSIKNFINKNNLFLSVCLCPRLCAPLAGGRRFQQPWTPPVSLHHSQHAASSGLLGHELLTCTVHTLAWIFRYPHTQGDGLPLTSVKYRHMLCDFLHRCYTLDLMKAMSSFDVEVISLLISRASSWKSLVLESYPASLS